MTLPPLARQSLTYIAAAALGGVTAFAMAPYGILPALFCFSAVILWVAKADTPMRAAAYSAVYAFGYFVVGLYWVQNALGVTMGDMPWLRPIALIGLPALLVPFWAVAGYVAGRFLPAGHLRAFGFIALVGVVEYLRAYLFTGFPWNYFAYAWGASELPAMQFSALTGVYAFNLLTLVWAGAIALWYYGRLWGLTIAMLAGLVPNVYGVIKLSDATTHMVPDVAVVIVQPNIEQSEKWAPTKQLDHFMKHITLSEDGLAQVPDGTRVAAVIWPETAIEDYTLAKDASMLDALMTFLQQKRGYEVRLVSGVLRGEQGRYYNSIVSLSAGDDGALTSYAVYDKRTLVPFGEYIPLIERFGIKPVTGFSGFSAGVGDGLMYDPALPPAIGQICYEAIFAHSVRRTHDAAWIVNVSNDGWYGDTSGPYQHLVMSRYRALETGLPMLRSTTTGISAVIDSYGRVLQSLGYGKSGVIVSGLPNAAAIHHATAYFGDIVFWVMVALLGVPLVVLRQKA